MLNRIAGVFFGDSYFFSNPVNKTIHETVETGDLARLETLINEGIDLESVDGEGRTPIQIACEFGKLDCLLRLLFAGANKAAQTATGDFPSTIAARKGHLHCANELLKFGRKITPELEDRYRQMFPEEQFGPFASLAAILFDEAGYCSTGPENLPVLMAARSGNEELVRALIAAGVDVNVASTAGMSPLHYTAIRGDVVCSKIFLDAGVSIDVKTCLGDTPLHFAADYGHEECIKKLLSEGANLEAINSDGSTPLYIAAMKGNVAAVRALLSASANVEAGNKKGSTPLHAAIRSGGEECVQILLEAGSNIEAVDENGATSLHKAILRGAAKCVKILLRAGANMEAKNANRHPPLHAAIIARQAECVRALLEAGSQVESKDAEVTDYLFEITQSAQVYHNNNFFCVNNWNDNTVFHPLGKGGFASPNLIFNLRVYLDSIRTQSRNLDTLNILLMVCFIRSRPPIPQAHADAPEERNREVENPLFEKAISSRVFIRHNSSGESPLIQCANMIDMIKSKETQLGNSEGDPYLRKECVKELQHLYLKAIAYISSLRKTMALLGIPNNDEDKIEQIFTKAGLLPEDIARIDGP